MLQHSFSCNKKASMQHNTAPKQHSSCFSQLIPLFPGHCRFGSDISRTLSRTHVLASFGIRILDTTCESCSRNMWTWMSDDNIYFKIHRNSQNTIIWLCCKDWLYMTQIEQKSSSLGIWHRRRAKPGQILLQIWRIFVT